MIRFSDVNMESMNLFLFFMNYVRFILSQKISLAERVYNSLCAATTINCGA